MKIEEIKKWKNKTISLEEIKQIHNIKDNKDIKGIIDELLEKNIISIIKNSGFDFQKPHLYKKYRITQKDYSKELEEVKNIINLNMKYYIKNPSCYEEDKEFILKIENYFKNKKHNELELSINERSLEIFNDEKMLSESVKLKTILGRLGLEIKDFNIYESKEIFMYYKNNIITNQKVLIVENKDTWNTIKRALIDNYDILGYNFDAVIYGEGKKIISSFAFIEDEEFKVFNSKENIFYYFGDLDSTGINIMDLLIKTYPQYKITPFHAGYEFLIKNIGITSHAKKDKNGNIKNDNKIEKDIISKYFMGYDVDKIFNMCEKSHIVPQETLNNRIIRGGINGL